MRALNVGCGDLIIKSAGDFVCDNLDGYWNPKADIHYNLENCGGPGEINAMNTYDVFYLSHVIEHIQFVLPMMHKLWLCAKPGAKMYILCPHGASDDADEDPTHVRRMFPLSFQAFAQPYYHKASYGYRGDWQPKEVVMMVPRYTELNQHTVHLALHQRNSVIEMYCELEAIKPARDRKSEQVIAPILLLHQPPDFRYGPFPR